MSEQSVYLLHLRPNGRVVFRDFFNAFGEIRSLLASPPQTRNGSFGLQMPAIPQLRDGEYWELHAEESSHNRVRTLRVYVDGTVIFRASADPSFLCWPRDAAQRIVNPVVVADSIVSFCRFVRELLTRASVRPAEVHLGVELRNAGQSDPPLMFYPGNLRRGMSYDLLDAFDMHGVGEMHPRRQVVLSTNDLLHAEINDTFVGADTAAYALVLAFYDIFGYADSDVPYVNRDGARPRIGVEAYAR